MRYSGIVMHFELKEMYSFEVKAVPPYSFDLTVSKPAGWWWSTPNEVFDRGTCWSLTRFKKELLGLKIWSEGTTIKPLIHCTVFTETKVVASEAQDITSMLRRALKVEEDLTGFYELSQKDDILRQVVNDLYGMHTVGWPELFPALILAVTLQMAPMKRSNQMMELLIANFGDQASFDGKTIRYWPSVETIASIAKKQLLMLHGIGEYSAELIMPKMGFPLDVWSAKIFNVLFFGKEAKKPREVIPTLKKVASKRWGRWRGHAFVYVLNDLPNLSKRIGFDLTAF
jgi:3-methyladenine DNA glycosylase/8-oxoguanine DNA glycosylase